MPRLRRYNFYHADGNGRDSFISHASAHQNENFNYVPKAPEMAGNTQPGMSCGLPGHYSEEAPEAATAQVVGYTGHFPGDRYAIGTTFQHSSQELMQTFRAHQAAGGPPPLPPAFPDCYPRPVNKPTSVEYQQSLAKQKQRLAVPSHRIPGYGGYPTGHQHVSGFTFGAICAADGTPNTQGAVIGEGAPGLGRPETISVVHPNLQPGAAPITNERFTKAGYTGHLPGRARLAHRTWPPPLPPPPCRSRLGLHRCRLEPFHPTCTRIARPSSPSSPPLSWAPTSADQHIPAYPPPPDPTPTPTPHATGKFSSNFGKQFSMAAKEMLLTNGQPGSEGSPYSGGVSDPNNPYNADVTAKLQYPAGHVGRPAKCVNYVAGYTGFRPQTTPFETIPGGKLLPFYQAQRA